VRQDLKEPFVERILKLGDPLYLCSGRPSRILRIMRDVGAYVGVGGEFGVNVRVLADG